jgi:peptide/nickel transport system ATP-binding protein
VLHGGRLVETGAPRNVIGNPGHPYTAALLAARFDLTTDRHRPLFTLPAARTQVAVVRQGCNYVSGCPIPADECKTRVPPLEPLRTHPGRVACFHAAQISTPSWPLAAPWPVKRADTNDIMLRLSGIKKRYPVGRRGLWAARYRDVLTSVDLSIGRGECVALLGESGAGKSTLLRIAAGLLAPDGGLVFRGDDTPQMVFQDAVSSLTPWLTIGEQIGERLRRSGLGADGRARRIDEALELVELDATLKTALPAELSVGQCQRAVIARAVVVPPKLLLCDEPTSAMDVSLAAAILNLFGHLRRRLDMAMLFVTHDLATARIVADRIAILKDGVIAIEHDSDAVPMIAPHAALGGTPSRAERGIR